MEKYLECARVTSTHGVRGNVRMESMCDSPAMLAGLKRMYRRVGGEYKEMTVDRSAVQKNAVLAHFVGIDTVDQAAAMRGAVLYADRDDMPLEDGSFFIADLLGLPVLDFESGEEYGTLAEVTSPAGRDIYTVNTADGGSFMIPAVPEFIKEISLGGDRPAGIYVKLIDGMRE